ncbi:FOG: Zn-finger [Moesziomyces antarcticus T-34]|uniref:FOG: Zn-finger n=1 Tax=Pseudozyma antarctica (strain T-34) TaxID=1151754 RepID=M9M4D9_PSEA3|nr:FOG: Zn-finger [Moesziomyces antarcticus T-34]
MDILELVHEDQRKESRPFDCQHPGCPKAFSSLQGNDKGMLCWDAAVAQDSGSGHARIHSQERPFSCHFRSCGKTFIQRSALTVHIRVHTGERPHVCESCSKAFSDSSSLARHRRIHTGRRPYKCLVPGCGKSFCRKTTLTKHTRRNHADAEGTYMGTGRTASILSNSFSVARSALPPHARSTFPQGLEHHYLAGVKVEDDGARGGHAYGYAMPHGEYAATSYSAPPMSSCASSNTSSDGFDLTRRSSLVMPNCMTGSSMASFYSPEGTMARVCSTPNTLTPASEMSHFPRTPDHRDSHAFDAHMSARPHFEHVSVANMAYGEPHGPSSFGSSMMPAPASFSVLSNGCVITSQSNGNIDPGLWEGECAPASSMGSHFYANDSTMQLQQMQSFQPHHAARSAPYMLRSATQPNPIPSSS